MITAKDIYNYIDEIAPYSLQEGYDNSGLNVLFNGGEVRRALIALDITNEIIAEAERVKADLIITHHPVIFRGLKTLDENNPAVKLCRAGISAVSAHTNFDSAKMNDIFVREAWTCAERTACCGKRSTYRICLRSSAALLQRLWQARVRSALGNTVVRYNDLGDDRMLSRIAVCSGSGGRFFRKCYVQKGGLFNNRRRKA